MSDSTLDPDNIPVGTDRILGRGHGTRALGPSDNSDSGSDVAGDPDISLDSDTDAEGTGERAEVEMELVSPGADIGFDHIEQFRCEAAQAFGGNAVGAVEVADQVLPHRQKAALAP